MWGFVVYKTFFSIKNKNFDGVISQQSDSQWKEITDSNPHFETTIYNINKSIITEYDLLMLYGIIFPLTLYKLLQKCSWS